MGGQSGSWTPTKRRGPIAAEFQGPGPAAIGLPSLFGSKYLLLLLIFKNSPKFNLDINSICITIFTRCPSPKYENGFEH